MKRSKLNSVIIVILTVYLTFPLFLTFIYSISSEWKSILPSGLTFSYYSKLFTDRAFLLPFLNTVIISVLPVLLCAILLLLVMYVIVVRLPKLEKVLEIICTIPYAIQGIILAIAVLSLYSGAPAPFSNRIIMLSLTYCIVILPYMYRGIKNSLNTLHADRLLEAAEMLGSSRFKSFFGIIVPNILPGISVSIMLSISLLFGDFVIINIMAGSYLQTAQIYLFRSLFESGQKSSAIVCVLFIVTLLITNGVLFLYSSVSSKRNRQPENLESDYAAE